MMAPVAVAAICSKQWDNISISRRIIIIIIHTITIIISIISIVIISLAVRWAAAAVVMVALPAWAVDLEV